MRIPGNLPPPSFASTNARCASQWLVLAVIIVSAACGGSLETEDSQLRLDGGRLPTPDSSSDSYVAPDLGDRTTFLCGSETCTAGQLCKQEVFFEEDVPVASKCVEQIQANDGSSCAKAEVYCRVGCLATDFPRVICIVE